MAKDNVDGPKTQRAYTLRLQGGDAEDHRWCDGLWATHDAVNKGAKAFGDWLLTLRGGLCHRLADAKVKQSKGKPDRDPTPQERHDRRVLLALSWLSVESAPKDGDKHKAFVIASGNDISEVRNGRVLDALCEILTKRDVPDDDIGDPKKKAEDQLGTWLGDCAPSLSAAIREDAVWVNRSAAFDAACQRVGGSLTRTEVWDMLRPFLGTPETYLAPPKPTEDSDADVATEDKAKDLVQKAGQWLSSRLGTGNGADFAGMAKVYEKMAQWNPGDDFANGQKAMEALADWLQEFSPESKDAGGILKLISGPGYKSATRNIVNGLGAQDSQVTTQDLDRLRSAAEEDSGKCRNNTGGKGPRPYSNKAIEDVQFACGLTYLQKKGPARHSEFAVMLDHAARRVSIGHSWIKRAEAERQKFEADAKKLQDVPQKAKEWLDRFCEERSGRSGALNAYRIRRRAIEGWKEVVTRWSRADCKTTEDRIAAARELQADPDIAKFGDIQLFEALAAEDALCVWQTNNKADPQPLINYVLAKDAQARQQRFKVPAYRHPDPLLHPVFCDFGNSRWKIQFAVHQAAKAAAKGDKKRKSANGDDEWLKDRHALRMGLWNGQTLDESQPLRWSCKRLSQDLALRQEPGNGSPVDVTRADRLGRAAAGAEADSAVRILSLFQEKEWNGRLQAPRPQLDAIARHVAKHGWDAKAKHMQSRIRWLVSFSAKLQPAGPWVEYAKQFSDDAPARPFVSRSGECAVKHEGNDKRKGHAKLILSRLPGLRVLSVDLGHRYAAACAVWETLSAEQVHAACQAANHPFPTESDMFLHLRTMDTSGRQRTTIYRRIGADYLETVDTGTGEVIQAPHPAPWAKLDRQFFIKLPGEEKPARAASIDLESPLVEGFARRLGLSAEDDRKRGRGVDELMSRAVRVARLGLARHARRAKIAYALNPDTKSIPGMGGSEQAFKVGDEAHVKLLTDALFDWHALATEQKWNDQQARELWNIHIANLKDGWQISESQESSADAKQATRQARRKVDEQFRQKLRPIAEQLANADRTEMHKAWNNRWNADDGQPAKVDRASGSKTNEPSGWHADLRRLTDYIMGKRLPGATDHGWKRNVGGLSLTRITTMRALYQLHKAFAMRARPDKPRGAPEKGQTNVGVAQSILNAMERMREQRVKQLASRIAEAALGIGRHKSSRNGCDRQRPMQRVDEPCHAVIIEDLTHYRPEEIRTRRENRQLMSWSSSKVKKYLSEACQLHGLHLREVQAGYTSRQDSRTGAPGVRCADIPVSEFMTAPWWRRQVTIAREKADAKRDARESMLADLDAQWSAADQQQCKAARPLRIPVPGGEIFVSADPHSPASKGLQADLNAAANIGLRALLDPDWPGKWWFVPCSTKDGKPTADKVKGAACIDSTQSLCRPSSESIAKTGGGRTKEIVNAWRDPSASMAGSWQPTPLYWQDVRSRVVNLLRCVNGLVDPEEAVEPEDTPW